MRIIGITGGIGSGKSTAVNILRSAGAKVIDSDNISRQLVEPGSYVLDDLVNEFGSCILKENGELNRKKLGELVFKDTKQLQKLNNIMHIKIADSIYEKIQKYKGQNVEVIVIEAPIPLEKGFLDVCDTIWCIAIKEKQLRKERIIKRDNLSLEMVENRINAQLDENKYFSVSDLIIYNDGDLTMFERKVLSTYYEWIDNY